MVERLGYIQGYKRIIRFQTPDFIRSYLYLSPSDFLHSSFNQNINSCFEIFR